MRNVKVLLVTFCATYSHTPLALYALRAYLKARGHNVEITYFTVNQPDGPALEAIYRYAPDVLGFSCYCWNIEKSLRVAGAVKKVLPDTFVVLGGPEITREYAVADRVIVGEGEAAWDALLAERGGESTKKLPMADIPFPYPDLAALDNKILYYEASRGCPFSCGYCLSCGDAPVRLKALDTVYKELQIFLDARVMRVKFTDRTFNANKPFAAAIWRYLAVNDNGVTCFHFEIAADILDAELLTVLSGARRGLFQFEIGVQTLNARALEAIRRPMDIPKLMTHVRALKAFGNIHLHLDLIAGLPFEGLASFKATFDRVFALEAEQLQLGFLKLLDGTPLRRDAQKLGLVYAEYPPYEILSTPHLSYGEILEIKRAEEMLELFYNSGKFVHTLRYVMRGYLSAFDFFLRLGECWNAKGYGGMPHGKLVLYEAMYQFCADVPFIKDYLRLDLLLNENERNVPAWMSPALNGGQKKAARELKEANPGAARVEFFSWDDTPVVFRYPKPGRQDFFAVRLLENISPVPIPVPPGLFPPSAPT